MTRKLDLLRYMGLYRNLNLNIVIMESLVDAIDHIQNVLNERGYQYYNVPNGGIGLSLKDGIKSFFVNMDVQKAGIQLPISASCYLHATTPDKPFTLATFRFIEDAKEKLKVASMEISMFECHDGGLKTSLELNIDTFKDIPTKAEAVKLIEEDWCKKVKNKFIKRTVSNKPMKRGRKM